MIKPRSNGGANRANNRKQPSDYKPKNPKQKPTRKQIAASLSLYAASKRQGGGND
ncbi:MAG TPA: hypothetical protein PK693_12380 [Halothiobacillus sp.]|jgi:hypothetical protein|nr:hypothetical protein [Halothiobacillus sp.]